MQKEKVTNQIVKFLKDYYNKSGLEGGFVVGLSGGIDSALTSILCCLTGIKTYVVTLPMGKEEKEKEGYKNALNMIYFLHGKFMNLTHQEIELNPVFEELKKANAKKLSIDNNLAEANAKSRLRMVELYYLANAFNGMVVGTGNKVEDFGVGFFTKYGDGGVDISPIGDLYKSEVKELANYLEIPSEIIEAKPTDGLWEDNRSDEYQLGLSYEEIEDIMKKGEKSEVSQEKKEKYKKLHESTKHKTNAIPICFIDENFKK